MAADPLFCDLLANVPLHLEHEVAVERVLEFKQVSFIAVTGMADSIAEHVQGISQQLALDVVTFSPNGLSSSKRGHTTRRAGTRVGMAGLVTMQCSGSAAGDSCAASGWLSR